MLRVLSVTLYLTLVFGQSGPVNCSRAPSRLRCLDPLSAWNTEPVTCRLTAEEYRCVPLYYSIAGGAFRANLTLSTTDSQLTGKCRLRVDHFFNGSWLLDDPFGHVESHDGACAEQIVLDSTDAPYLWRWTVFLYDTNRTRLDLVVPDDMLPLSCTLHGVRAYVVFALLALLAVAVFWASDPSARPLTTAGTALASALACSQMNLLGWTLAILAGAVARMGCVVVPILYTYFNSSKTFVLPIPENGVELRATLSASFAHVVIALLPLAFTSLRRLWDR